MLRFKFKNVFFQSVLNDDEELGIDTDAKCSADLSYQLSNI
jgi:hypothetical protein